MITKIYNFFDLLKNTPARKNKIIVIINIVSLLINGSLWFFLYFQLKKIINLSPELTVIPLHYNVFFGIDLIGRWQMAFLLPLISLIIFLVNTLMAFLFYSKKSLISYFLTFATLFIQIIFLASGLFIILLNI